jgi:hypothetical protein
MIAGTPHHGGATWAVLQYLLGLRRLGFDPYFVEPVDHVADDAVRYADRVMSSVGLDDRWALLGPDGSTAGMDRGRLTAAVPTKPTTSASHRSCTGSIRATVQDPTSSHGSTSGSACSG